MAAEAFRDRWPFAFPWGRLAMSQSVAPDVRWVAVGGVPLLTFLVALAGAMAARAVLCFSGGAIPPGPPLLRGDPSPQTPLGGTSAPPDPPPAPWRIPQRPVPAGAGRGGDGGLVLAGGLLPVDPTGGAPTAVVAAIQGNVPRARNLPQQLNDTEVTQNQAAATLKLAAEVKAGRLPAPDAGGLAGGLHRASTRARTRPSTPRSPGRWAPSAAPILVGEVLQDPLRNAGQLWVPGVGPTTIYVKRQLVPFGEYIPFRGIISSFSSLPSLQPVNFTPGHRPSCSTSGRSGWAT